MLAGKDAQSNVFMALKEAKSEIAAIVKQGGTKSEKAIADKLDSLESTLSKQNEDILSAINSVTRKLVALD
jgi:vacuolar-type H+-ATPase subunit E/Vma4